MLPSWLTQDLVPDVSSVLAKSMLCSVFASPNILYHTFLASNTIYYPLGLTIELPIDLNNHSSSSGFHHLHFKNKTAHRTASPLLVAPMHSIHHSSFSSWNWSGDPCSDELTSQISTDLVGN